MIVIGFFDLITRVEELSPRLAWESQRSLVRLRDNRRRRVVFLLYVLFDKFPAYNGTCYYFNSYGPERYCIKSWAYFWLGRRQAYR